MRMSHEDAHETVDGVTDADIDRILEQNEAGVGALMATYEPIEQSYFGALSATSQTVTYTTSSSAR